MHCVSLVCVACVLSARCHTGYLGGGVRGGKREVFSLERVVNADNKLIMAT